MGGKRERVTVGYRYLLSMQQVYCHGPVDQMNEIRVDDRQAFLGYQTEGELFIVKPYLFGGDDREGGVLGKLDVEFGGPSQQSNAHLVSKLGSLVPAFRGITQLVLKSMEMGMNPYLKPWSATFQRIFTRQDGIEQWYPQKAAIPRSSFFVPGPEKKFTLDGVDDASPEFDENKGVLISGLPRSSSITFNVSGAWSHFNNDSGNGGKSWQVAFEVALVDGPDMSFHSGFFETAEQAEQAFKDQHPNGITLTGASGYHFWLQDTFPEDDRGSLQFSQSDPGFTVDVADMNPAHIIRECDTDPDWGMGYPEADIDAASFTAAADQLFAEEMGMSLLWDRQTPLEDFVDDVARHIDAVHDIDRRTGKFRLKLIRDDFEVDDLIVLGPSQIDRVENYGRPTPGDVINQVTVRYWDATTRDTQSVTVEDTALISRDGGIINQTVDYPGFTRQDIALRVAARDLRAGSIPLLSATLFCDKTADELSVGDPFVFEWPDLHEPGIVMRVTEIAFGDGVNNHIRIQCTEDVFAISDDLAIGETETEWEDPVSDPQVAQNRLAFEAPYYELVQDKGQTAVDERLAENPDIGIVMAAAARPTNDSINAAMHTDSGAGYEQIAVLDFCPSATLAAAVGPVDTAWTIENGVDLDNVDVGTHCQVGDELCSVIAIDEAAGTMTAGRAVLDTVPDPDGYPAGTRIYFWDEFGAADPREYATAETIDVKLLPTTGIGQLTIANAPADQVTIQQRAYLPYPPGNLKVNTEYFPETIGGAAALALTWAHRDRLQQTAGDLVPFTGGDVGPETGQTYTLRLYGEDESLGRTESGIVVTSYTYLIEDEAADFEIVDEAAGTSGPPSATRDAMGASLSGSLKWFGAVAADNGRVYGIPFDATDILNINSAAGTATRDAMGASLSGTFKFVGGVKASNGKIYGVPYSSTDILIIDPAAGTATRDAMGASLSGSEKWFGGALGSDGKIYCSPFDVADILIIDPAAGTATRDAMGASLSGSNKWSGGVAGDDGKLYFVPQTAADILIIDPAAGTATRDAMGASLSGTLKWIGGVKAPNGKIYCIPFNATDILIIDPAAGTATRDAMGASLSGTQKWYGGALGADGKIYGIPFDATDILIIDPVAGTATRDALGAALTGTLKWTLGAAIESFIYGAPRNSADIFVLEFPQTEFRLNGRLRFELESVRDGVTSFQKHNVEVRRPGWNFNWDMYWDGGAP